MCSIYLALMPLGRRCDLGCASWPDEAVYSTCVVCGERTTRYKDLNPLPEEEARSMLLRAQFERYYEKRCASRGISADGPLPPEYK